jgi:hypothetical protein
VQRSGNTSTAALLLLTLVVAGCGGTTSAQTVDRAGHSGTVAGTLLFVGGPPPGRPRPVPTGTVTLRGGVVVHAEVDRRGRFAVVLPAGRYRATGRSSRYGDGAYVCHAQRPVHVATGRLTHATVFCQLR